MTPQQFADYLQTDETMRQFFLDMVEAGGVFEGAWWR